MEKKQRKLSNVLIDTEYLRQIIRANCKSAKEFAESIGRSDGYLDNCLRRGYMQIPVVKLIQRMYDIDLDKLVPPPKETEVTEVTEVTAVEEPKVLLSDDETLKALVNTLIRVEKKLDKLIERVCF